MRTLLRMGHEPNAIWADDEQQKTLIDKILTAYALHPKKEFHCDDINPSEEPDDFLNRLLETFN